MQTVLLPCRRFFAARLGTALQRRRQHVPVRKAHGRNMIAEAACSRSSLSKKAGIADLFRQDTFPLRLRRGRGNAQGNLAAQGFRTRRACRRVRIVFEGLRPSKPPQRGLRRSAAADGTERGLLPLPASPQKCVPFVDTLRLAAQGFRTRRIPRLPGATKNQKSRKKPLTAARSCAIL